MISLETELNRLDAGAGDGDCGSTIAYGAKGQLIYHADFAFGSFNASIISAILSSMGKFDFGRPSVWLDQVRYRLCDFQLAKGFQFFEQLGRVLGSMGGTSGGIYSLFLTAASGAIQVRIKLIYRPLSKNETFAQLRVPATLPPASPPSEPASRRS